MLFWPTFILYISLAGAMATLVLFLHPKTRNRTIKCITLFFASVYGINLAAQLLESGQNTGWDAFFYSFIGTLQTFSLDAGYQDIMANLSAGTVFFPVLHIIVSLILMIAPIAGGAAILVMIADVFPIVSYAFRSRLAHRIYLFSHLNEQSLHLAEALITQHEAGYLPCIVFANSRAGEGSEDGSDLVGRAKEIGAICLEEDLSLLRIPRKKIAAYFLARGDDMRNLEDAIYLASDGQKLWQDCAEVFVYVYAQSELAPNILEPIYNKENGLLSKLPRPDIFKLTIIPYVTNTVYRLLFEHPLYRYLGDASERERLSVVILGDDDWAVEFFKAVFWCGQIPNKELHITCISQDKDAFASKMRYLIPEIDCCDSDHTPYCIWKLFNAAPRSAELEQLICAPEICDAQVWFVSLGGDQLNMETAAFIRQRLDALHLRSPRSAVVHYLVSKDHLMKTMNQIGPESERDLCAMHAIASLQEQYSLAGIWGDLHEFAWMLDDIWSHMAKDQTAENEYRRRSSLASAVHLEYKLYAFGLLTSTEGGWEDIKKGLRAYIEGKNNVHARDSELAYLEHRRWNAYMRTAGYRGISLEEWEKAGKTNSKDPARKLHTCLVESRPDRHPLQSFAFLANAPMREVCEAERKGVLDGLDTVSLGLYRLNKAAGTASAKALDPDGIYPGDDYKKYDIAPTKQAAVCFLVHDALRQILRRSFPNRSIHYFTPWKDAIWPKRHSDDLSSLLIKELSGPSRFDEGSGFIMSLKKQGPEIDQWIRAQESGKAERGAKGTAPAALPVKDITRGVAEKILPEIDL